MGEGEAGQIRCRLIICRLIICRLIMGRCHRFSDRIQNAGRSRSGLSYVTHNATLETDIPHIHAITMPFPHALIVLIASLRSAAHPYLAAPRGLSRPLDLAERSDRARQGGSTLKNRTTSCRIEAGAASQPGVNFG